GGRGGPAADAVAAARKPFGLPEAPGPAEHFRGAGARRRHHVAVVPEEQLELPERDLVIALGLGVVAGDRQHVARAALPRFQLPLVSPLGGQGTAISAPP